VPWRFSSELRASKGDGRASRDAWTAVTESMVRTRTLIRMEDLGPIVTSRLDSWKRGSMVLDF
jgi:hypothetical protein